MMRLRALLVVLGLGLAACGGNGADEPSASPTPSPDVGAGQVSATYDFDAGSDGWASDISDFSDETRPDDLLSETGTTPPGLDEGSGFFHLAATNTSDDLFLYLRRQVGPELPLEPDTDYEVAFTVRFASNAPSDCVGIGGPPGESVWLKVGAVPEEPVPVDEGGRTELSVDKGGQSQGGEDAAVAGVIANGIPCEEAQAQELPFAMVTLEHTLADPVTTTSDGSLWLLVGTDSGFEGRTSLYYDRILVTFTPAG